MYLYCCCVLIDLQNNELEKIVKDLLDGADLEQVTMKSVCKQVSSQVSLNSLCWHVYLLRRHYKFGVSYPSM